MGKHLFRRTQVLFDKTLCLLAGLHTGFLYSLYKTYRCRRPHTLLLSPYCYRDAPDVLPSVETNLAAL